MHSWSWLVAFAPCGLAALLFAQGCFLTERDKVNVPSQPDSDTLSHVDTTLPPPEKWEGAYRFPTVDSGAQFSLDSTYEIAWIRAPSVGDGQTEFATFYGNGSRFGTTTGLPPEGSILWTPSANGTVGSGTGYRFRIVQSDDTTLQGWSPPFSLTSNYSGSFVLTSPEAGFQARTGTPITIAWTSSGNVGSEVGLELYRGSELIGYAAPRLPTAPGSFTWEYAAPSMPTGSNYRFRIFSWADSEIDAFGPEFTLLYEPDGTFTFLAPLEGARVEKGGKIPLEWTVQGEFGSFCQLTWWRDSPRDSVAGHTPISCTGSSGNATPPLEVTPGIYRLRMATFPNPVIQEFSPAFSVD